MRTTKTDIWQLTNGFYIEPKTTELGEHYVYSDFVDNDDPDKLDPAIMQCFIGKPRHKIPRRLWNQMVTFFMHYLAQGTEVECRYYKRHSEFICVVGSQSVAGASVTYNYALPLYGLDGVRYTRESLVADGWILYGHFHLHPFDMPSPSGVDDTNEMKTPLLYGIISIPTGKRTNMDYRIRTTVVASNGDHNYRYFPDAWDFIELPADSELQTYTHVPYSPICESQVKRYVYTAPLTTYSYAGCTTKWLGSTQSQGGVVYSTAPKNLAERISRALESVLLADSAIKVSDLERELPAVLSDLLNDEIAEEARYGSYDSYYGSNLITHDNADLNDPYHFNSGV